MKKIVSLILAVMMIASLTVTAFADTDSNATLDTTTAVSKINKDDITTGDMKTELYLTVDAKGQIDVTVPLVLLFSTDINGGQATEPATYKFSSNTPIELAVTSIVVDHVAKNDSNPMSIVGKDDALDQNQYKGTLTVGDYVYDLSETSQSKPAKEGGLFKIAKCNVKDTRVDTIVKAAMETGALNFVTKRTDDDNQMEAGTGLKLLTVTYTVGIDTSEQYGGNSIPTVDDVNTGVEAG